MYTFIAEYKKATKLYKLTSKKHLAAFIAISLDLKTN